MEPAEPNNDYNNGQMMGMLSIIRQLKLKGHIPAQTLDNIERVASESLSEYFQKPQEDIILLVDKKLEE